MQFVEVLTGGWSMKLLRYTTYLIIYIHTIILYFWMMISANGGGCYTFSLGRKQIFDEAGADFGAEGRGVDGDARVTQGVEVPDLSFRVHQQLQWRFGTVLHLLHRHANTSLTVSQSQSSVYFLMDNVACLPAFLTLPCPPCPPVSVCAFYFVLQP